MSGQPGRAAELAQEPNAHQGARAFAAGIVAEAGGDGEQARGLLELAWRPREPAFARSVATALARLSCPTAVYRGTYVGVPGVGRGGEASSGWRRCSLSDKRTELWTSPCRIRRWPPLRTSIS